MPTHTVDRDNPDPEIIARAAAVIRGGGLVAFPTETVYGLGANALDPAAVRRIFEAKGRPSYNPLIAHVADAAAARDLSADWPAAADALAAAFWPGPLTLVVPKRADVPDELTAGLASVALRVPSHPVARLLLLAAELPIAAPSANRFTQVSPTTASHVEKALGDRVDLILDGGPTEVGIESTVIDLTGARPTLLRHGSLSRDEIEAVVGKLDDPRAHAGNEPRPAPGMVERHYSPHARLEVYEASRRGDMAATADRAAAEGLRVGGLLRSSLSPSVAVPIMMPAEPASYARELYAALHALDDSGCDVILVDAVPDGPEWAGIRDRLRRASHPA